MARRVVATPKPNLSQPSDMALLGAVVRNRRTGLNITLEDAAGLCGVSKQAYNNVELGSENIKVETLFKVLTAFGISLRVTDLNGGSDTAGLLTFSESHSEAERAVLRRVTDHELADRLRHQKDITYWDGKTQ